jgi:hypothetical protein
LPNMNTIAQHVPSIWTYGGKAKPLHNNVACTGCPSN